MSFIFFREQERKVDPELGFLDSTRYTNPYAVKKSKESLKLTSRGKKPSVVSLSARIDQDQKEHDKRVKVIEVCIYMYIYSLTGSGKHHKQFLLQDYSNPVSYGIYMPVIISFIIFV